MSLKDKCGACKWYYSQLEPHNTVGHYCYRHNAQHTSPTTKKCAYYRPYGFMPEEGKGLCFADFVEQCRVFYLTKLKPLGYVDIEFDDLTITTRPNPVAFYHMEVSRLDPRRNNEKVCALMLSYSAGDEKPLMLFENMCSFDYIPKEYGDLRKPEMPEQAPQFVYGYYSRLGDALNSMLKGCSIDLRKPIELYY